MDKKILVPDKLCQTCDLETSCYCKNCGQTDTSYLLATEDGRGCFLYVAKEEIIKKK